MSYAAKYSLSFNSIYGDDISVLLEQNLFVGASEPLVAANEQPVLIERQAPTDTIGGVCGTACRIKIINDGTFDVAEFVANEYTDWRCRVLIGGQLKFIGFIVVDDLTNEYRVTPYGVELVFTDNLALLSDTEAPFLIETQFTAAIQLIGPMLAQTGLELPLNVFFQPYPIS